MDTINVLIKLYRINDWFISKCSSLGTSYPIKSYNLGPGSIEVSSSM